MLWLRILYVSSITETYPGQNPRYNITQVLIGSSSNIWSSESLINVSVWNAYLEPTHVHIIHCTSKYKALLFLISFTFGKIIQK